MYRVTREIHFCYGHRLLDYAGKVPTRAPPGFHHRERSAHFAEVYGASVSKETVSRITDRVIEEMTDWSVRPLDEVYASIFIDAIVVKVRDGQVANRPIYAAIGVNLDGERDILGLWAGTGGEGAKFWMAVLTDLRNRGVRDVFFVVHNPGDSRAVQTEFAAQDAPRPDAGGDGIGAHANLLAL